MAGDATPYYGNNSTPQFGINLGSFGATADPNTVWPAQQQANNIAGSIFGAAYGGQQTPPVGDFPQGTPSNTIQGNAGSTGTSNFNPQIYEAQYQAGRANLLGQLDTLQPAQQAAQLQALNSYQNNLNTLDTQNAQGTRNLNLAQDQVNRSKAQSLQQLRDQVGSMYNSYLRQPGVSDSSAGGMIAQALGSSASKNRYGVLQNSSNQTQQIGNQQQDMQTQYDSQHQALDQWKASTLNDIAMKFLQSRQDIERQLATADATKAQALAQQNQGLVQDAVNALSNLQNLYGTQKQQLISQYQNIAAPSADLGNLGQYQVQPIDAGKLQGIRQGQAPTNNQTPDLVAPIFQKKQNDQFNFA